LLYPAELRAQNKRAEYVALESEIQPQKTKRISRTIKHGTRVLLRN